MNTPTVLELAGAAAEHGQTFLGEDFNGWRVATVVGVVIPIVWELTMALTRQVTLRAPFLVLYIAWFTTPKEEWKPLYKLWKAELWAILNTPGKHWLVRFLKGMVFAVPLACGGARATAIASMVARRTVREGLAAGRQAAAEALVDTFGFVSGHKIDRAVITNAFVYMGWGNQLDATWLKTLAVLLCVSACLYSLSSVLALHELRREYRKRQASAPSSGDTPNKG
ncbi:hypothetical protein [Streptomyces sp. MBT62]|uniref:hypothetical protein n=1 Tax=Streptomyces sp. MBT62 TaxID=2800410 RepID=UPI00190C49AD|nr:hypothetical protein [Streptomyces sp. MBT62]MBK3564534.1 hypothetical protein [Streptomyces sp. MBT62]